MPFSLRHFSKGFAYSNAQSGDSKSSNNTSESHDRHDAYSNISCKVSGEGDKQPRPSLIIRKYEKNGNHLTFIALIIIQGLITGGMGGFGVTGGAHRLWTHRAYKANMPLRIILAACYLVAGENSIYNWVRDHRIHHKFSETDADPHDSRRGFFFSHVGWLMMKKHPEVIRRGKQVDMSDITSDPVAAFVDSHFTRLKLLACFILPIVIPVYCWNEELWMTIVSQVFIRYPWTLNATWSVNSFAHIWGNHSYDKSIRPAENKWVAWAAMGEGWHNYHHAFPWDYKAAELGNYKLNMTTMFIDGFAKIGWAYDLKKASTHLVQKVTENRGDGTHETWGKNAKSER